MTTPSSFSDTGISILASKSIISTSVLVYNASLTKMIDGYSHTISANGGYKSADISMTMRQDEIEDWIENGLGRDIITYNEGAVPIWEGFVNNIEANIGGLNIKRGPLMGVANNVALVYSTVDTSVTPPAVGIRKKTAYQPDLISQSKYGIIEKILSCGGSTEANATNIRDTYLKEMAYPATTQTINIGSRGGLNINLNCLGYGEWLKAYTYNYTTSGTTTISARIQTVLVADPNDVISSDYTKLTANTLSIPSYTNDDLIALDYINGLVNLGDTTYDRYIFGIYKDRIAHYTEMPTAQEYTWHLSDGGMVTTLGGSIVDPWNVLPAKWIFIPDFMIGRIPTTTNLRNDPRYLFIEDVSYTAPYGLTLNGAKISKMPQILGQLGLMGIGA